MYVSAESLLRGQAELLRVCSKVSRADAAVAESLAKETEEGPHRVLRLLPLVQRRIAEHTTQIAKKDPCCSLIIHYDGLQDSDVVGLPLWGRLRDVEVSLEKSDVFAQIRGEPAKKHVCTATVVISQLRNTEGDLVSFPEALLSVFETYVVFQGERLKLISRTPWVMHNEHHAGFGPLAVSYTRVISFRLPELGEYSIIIAMGEAQKKTVCNLIVSGSARLRAKKAPKK